MMNEIGKKRLLKFFADFQGFDKVVIQSQVFCGVRSPE